MELLAALLAPLAFAAPAPAADMTCREHVEPPPPAPLQTGDGIHVWRVAHGGATFRLITTDMPSPVRAGGKRWWGWKTPFGLTADAEVLVTATGARFQDGRARTYARAPRAMRFTACPADEPLFSGPGVVGPTTGWGGGLMTRERRACVRFRVTSASAPDERPATLTVPLGRRSCPS